MLDQGVDWEVIQNLLWIVEVFYQGVVLEFVIKHFIITLLNFGIFACFTYNF